MRRLLSAALAALSVASARVASAQADPSPRPLTDSLYVRDVGPGRPGRLLRDVLRRPHIVLRPAARATLRRGETLPRTTILLGPELAVDGTIQGDLVVVGGDAFVHPGAVVEGRAIGIGGCIYPSALATVRGGVECFQDETFDVQRDASGHLALRYRSLVDRSVALFRLPLGIGLRIPTYDRVNGASVAFGPIVSLDTGRITLEPLVTYRSNLGAIDPAVFARVELGRRNLLEVTAQRGTFTNERWIRDSLVNSIITLIRGTDARNYYRADRVEAIARRTWEGASGTLDPWIGARTERAWSAGLDTTTRRRGRRPWALIKRNDVTDGMRRPNPRVLHDRITSALVGAQLDWTAAGGLETNLDLGTEVSVGAPSGRGFVQGVLDATVAFPVVREHTLRMQLHALLTASDSTPAQRYSYVGGSGTIPTRDLLEMGGDRLLHLDSRYEIPLDRPVIPFLGSPTVAIRHVIGSAGVGRLPAFAQNVGLRVTVGMLRAEFMMDPARGDRQVSASVALGR